MTHKKPITKLIAGVLSVVMVFGVLMFVSPTEAQAISLNATDTGFYNVAYDNNGVTIFGAGAQIRVINATRGGKNKSDAVYQFDGAMDWEPVGENYVVWQGTENNTFYGVYPYNAEYTSFTISTDQSRGVQDADWMTDDFTANKSVGNVQFDFQHRLAKVTVNITQWNNEFDGSNKVIVDPKIYTKGTDIEVDHITGVCTSDGTLAGIDPYVDGTSYTAIVAPAEYTIADKFMTFTVDGQQMTILAKTDTLTGGLQPGNHYTFDLAIGKDAVTLSSVTVSDWNKVDLDGGVAKECEHETTVNNGACAVCGKQVYVDLGLSVNWATVNIGATKPEEAGDYFAWGETEPKDTYNWSTYRWCNGSNNTMTKYCTSSSYGYNGFTDNITELDATDDAAIQNWGDGWMMPTQEQLAELLDENNCTWTWTTVNGVTGYQITSKVPGYEGNSIFLPSASYKDDGGSTILTNCYYWTSTLYTEYDTSHAALCLSFHSNSIDIMNGNGRFRGCLIRPVLEK